VIPFQGLIIGVTALQFDYAGCHNESVPFQDEPRVKVASL
jgi:hypothetical protein